jgi:flagellar protein FlbD
MASTGEGSMIELNRLDGSLIVINSSLIEYIERAPDTIITLTSGNKFLVRQSVQEVKQLVTHFQQMIHSPPSLPG